jgi:hypothetical protein
MTTESDLDTAVSDVLELAGVYTPDELLSLVAILAREYARAHSRTDLVSLTRDAAAPWRKRQWRAHQALTTVLGYDPDTGAFAIPDEALNAAHVNLARVIRGVLEAGEGDQ